MAENLSLSIAMATYNGAAHLEAQLQSLANQTVKPAELVVTDDGSSDATFSVLDAFAATAPFPVRVFRGARRRAAIERSLAPEKAFWLAKLGVDDRLGYADNFLLCAHLCSSDLVAFCDQDDIWLAEKNERCLAPFADPAIGMVSCSGLVVDGDGVSTGARLPDYPRDTVMPPLSIWPWQNVVGFSQTFRRDLLSIVSSEVRPPDHIADGVAAHDRWTFFLNHALHKTALLSKTLVHHRRHDANTTGRWQKPTVGTNMALVAGAGAETYAKLARSARGRADILTGALDNRPEFSAAVGYYQALQRMLARRSSLYQKSAGPAERWRLFGGIARQGGYRPRRQGGLGRKALLKDFLTCLGGRLARS